MISNEERREVAERLRKDVGESSCIDYAVFRIAHEVLGIEHVTGAKAAHMLADLIDPTYKRVSMDAAGNPPFYTGGLALNDVTGGCSVCGYPFGNSCRRIGNPLGVPNYCPNCGARVTGVDA